MTLEPDYTLQDVADALGMSVKWVRGKVKEGATHTRYGQKIRFTAEQVEALRAAHVKNPVQQSITTGRKRKSA